MEEILKTIAPVLGILMYGFLFQAISWNSSHETKNPRNKIYLVGRKWGFICKSLTRKCFGNN